jgi:hypothetical protein
MVKFSKINAKLEGQGILTFKLPAGHSCPGAKECRTFADPDTGVITDGVGQKYRCYMALMEAAFKTVRTRAWDNYNTLVEARTTEKMVELLALALPRGWRGVRIHDDGDFFNLAYFRAWLAFARVNPRLLFYAYTKSLPFWVVEMQLGNIPDNLVLTASYGGRYDHLIAQHDLRNCRVVNHPDEAEALGLTIDHDDSLARNARVKSFALLLHGHGQKKGSEASAALKRMRDEGIEYSYSSK